MPLIIIIVLFVILKYFEVWKFTELSWWWAAGLTFAAFIWFEFLEKMFGLDKRKAHDEADKMRERRKRETFGKKK